MLAAPKRFVTESTKRLTRGWRTYAECGTCKADQLAFGCCGAVSEDEGYINTLRSDLCNSYYWTGNCLIDYIFFCAQWHPLLGIIFCHPNHPWSKLERIVMFLIAAEITMIPSACIARSSDDDVEQIFIIVFVTLPNLLAGVLLYQLSIADMRCPNLCGLCCKWTSRFCFVVLFLFGAMATILSYAILHRDGHNDLKKIIQPWIIGQLYSLATWFPLWIIIPCQVGFLSLWCAEKDAVEEAEAQGFNGDDVHLIEAAIDDLDSERS